MSKLYRKYDSIKVSYWHDVLGIYIREKDGNEKTANRD